MKKYKIFKEVNSLVWTVELYENNEYIESFYSRTKKEAILHAEKVLKYKLLKQL